MKEIISNTIIIILIIFSTLFTTQSVYSDQIIREAVLIKNGTFNKEPSLVECTIVKKMDGFSVVNIYGNKHVSGYYIVRGVVKKKKGEKFHCLTDGYSIEIMKKVRKEIIK